MTGEHDVRAPPLPPPRPTCIARLRLWQHADEGLVGRVRRACLVVHDLQQAAVRQAHRSAWRGSTHRARHSCGTTSSIHDAGKHGLRCICRRNACPWHPCTCEGCLMLTSVASALTLKVIHLNCAGEHSTKTTHAFVQAWCHSAHGPWPQQPWVPARRSHCACFMRAAQCVPARAARLCPHALACGRGAPCLAAVCKVHGPPATAHRGLGLHQAEQRHAVLAEGDACHGLLR